MSLSDLLFNKVGFTGRESDGGLIGSKEFRFIVGPGESVMNSKGECVYHNNSSVSVDLAEIVDIEI